MTPRAMLLTGLGLLAVGLLLVLDADAATASPGAVLTRGYLANACALVGAGLVVGAALLRSLRPPPPAPRTAPPAIDHYS